MNCNPRKGLPHACSPRRPVKRRTLARIVVAILSLGLSMDVCGCSPSASPMSIGTTTQPVAVPEQVPGVANFAKVSNVLYRGAQPSAIGFQTLRHMGIKTVVDLRGKIHHDELAGTGLRGIQIPSSAAHPDERQIIEFLRFLRDPANQPVFAHDESGGSRTGCYVAAFRMVEQGWTARDAEVELRYFKFDPFWKGIPAFLNQLDVVQMRRELSAPPTTTPVQGTSVQTPGVSAAERRIDQSSHASADH